MKLSSLTHPILLLALLAITSISKAEPEVSFTPSFVIPEVDGSYYFETLNQLESKDPAVLEDIDFLNFRHAYLKVRDEHDLSIPTELEKQYAAEMNKEELDADLVISLCNQILALDRTDLNRQIIRSYLLSEKGQDVTFDQTLTSKLIDSILETGDGSTPETALHIFQVKEEYEILKMYGLQKLSQKLIHIGDHSFDIIECQNEEGSIIEVYFDITEHMGQIKAQLNK